MILGLTLALPPALALADSDNPSFDPLEQDKGPERQSVLERPKPDYDPLGIRLGSFILRPSLALQTTYDSNIYARPTGDIGDFIISEVPNFTLDSDWSRHAIGLVAGGEFKQYLSRTTEDNNNALIKAYGRLDIQNETYLLGGVGYQLGHEDRSSPDDLGGRTPTEYHVESADFSFVREPYRLGTKLEFSVNRYDYTDVSTSTGIPIQETLRNHTEYIVTPELNYEIIPEYRAFIRGSANWRDYDSRIALTGFNENSNGYAVSVGTAFDVSHIINGEVYVGYLEQDYDDSRLTPESGPGFGGKLLWNVTGLTSIKAVLDRSVQETDITGASGFTQTLLHVTVEHELLRNLVLTAGGSYQNADYQGISRTDDTYEAAAGFRYYLDRNINLIGDLRYDTRNSTGLSANFDIISASLRVQFQF